MFLKGVISKSFLLDHANPSEEPATLCNGGATSATVHLADFVRVQSQPTPFLPGLRPFDPDLSKDLLMKLRFSRWTACCLAALAMATTAYGQEPAKRTLHQQPSYTLSNAQVELAVTELGGHMAPVTFYRDGGKPIQPYHISPWQDEPPKEMPVPVLVPLRGDFFCMPFGGNAEAVSGEKHPPHGEVAGSPWKMISSAKRGDVSTLTLAIETKIRKGKVTKELSLVDSQNIVYSKHTISGFAGPVPLGHHATLAMPQREGSVKLSVSPFRFGMTYPGVFSDPKQREYQSLLPNAKWQSLSHVPVAWKDQSDADLSLLPARYGYADLVQIINEPWTTTSGPAWTTATFLDEDYVWFSLKDPAVLASTVFWIENHGRHGHPWNGRNHCLGLEDVTAYFADGLQASTSDNTLSSQGVITAIELKPDHPTTIHYIQGVARVPEKFDGVRTIEFDKGSITLVSLGGDRVTVPVRHEFLKSGQLNQP